MLDIKIDKDTMNKIAQILMVGEMETVNIYYNTFGTAVYFSTESYQNALCLRSNRTNYVITNIELKNKRIGTLTKILNELKNLATRDSKKIIFENVLTKEMYNFCIKNGFKKIDNEISKLMPESFIGSYILD